MSARDIDNKLRIYSAGPTGLSAVRNIFGGADNYEVGGDESAYVESWGFSRLVVLRYPQLGVRKKYSDTMHARGDFIPGGAIVTILTPFGDEFNYIETTHPVLAYGASSLDALYALAKEYEWEELDKIEPMNDDSPDFSWGYSFTAGGTGMKAAGVSVPGGNLVTWWK